MFLLLTCDTLMPYLDAMVSHWSPDETLWKPSQIHSYLPTRAWWASYPLRTRSKMW